jgi:hypothetical protein
MKHREITGTYGCNKSTTEIFIYENRDGSRWYVAEGGQVVNLTYEGLDNGCWIEEVRDADCFTWSSPIRSLDELIEAVEN